MRVPETSLLAAVIMLEIGLWCLVLVTFAPYHYFCVGPAELWDRTDGFLGYLFAFLMEGVHHPAIRRQMFFYSAMVYLIGGGPYLLFKVCPQHGTFPSRHHVPGYKLLYHTTTSLDFTLYHTKPYMRCACTTPLPVASDWPGSLWAATRLRVRPQGQRARGDDRSRERAQIQARAAGRVQHVSKIEAAGLCGKSW